MKQVRLRALAAADIKDASDYYRAEAGPEVGLEFVRSLEKQLQTIGDFPALGSTWYETTLGVLLLRTIPVTGFPYTVFYLEREKHLDVLRVLHNRRDIPQSFGVE
ncbi:MAG: type II toxin-antitoxin system RelE/ParE family toxin [Ancrocorticia sp.]|uniref:type II toxin-antitoxin system RelE/ParE family toxin n=1 Tax=Ancrocorticia sp. TaxID=2593684 RepID=UPI003F8F615C